MSRDMNRLLPTFICIGAQRAGTTWLYHCLKEHPDIYMPSHKELRFFNYNYSDGLDTYLENFSNASNEKVRGEITPDYYRQEYALLRIKKHIPDIKLIFIIRNPIERAFSQYELYCGTEYKEMSFEETYKNQNDLIEWGKYGKNLEFIYQHFPKTNVLVLNYDLLKGNPEAFLKQVFVFLQVDDGFKPDNLTKTYNKVIYPKLQRVLKSIGLQVLIDYVKKGQIGEWIRNQQKKKKSGISKNEYNYLSECFRDDVEKLGFMLNTDLTYWLNYDNYKQ
jgi:hypothetical protein